MNRDYSTGTEDNAVFFTGIEVEKTPAYGMKTLFVVGVQGFDNIRTFAEQENCKHIFFGANHSFSPKSFDDWNDWENMIRYFLEKGILCTLDIPIALAEEFLESPLVEYHNFIPQIRVPLPYVKQWNYNTMLKIDDKDFKATNPGVWCHRLHNLMSDNTFTDWSQYGNDEVLDDNN